MIEYTAYDGIGLSALIRKREISIAELLESVICRIDDLNPRLNAVVYELFEQARATAAVLEKKIYADGLDSDVSPFYGLPFLIKNLVAECADTPFSDSSLFVDGYISKIDSELIRRYKQAGLIICGRTNASEFGVKPAAESVLYGVTRNPWNLEYTAGGSSGGAAAAVASGMVPVAHGNDGGGSLRVPASCCGLFSLKPDRGRNSLGPLFGDLGSGIVCEHVVSKTVRDTAAMLDISHGPANGDPYFAPHFTGTYLDKIDTAPGKLRIALLLEIPDGWAGQNEVHQDCKAAAEYAAKLCEELGHKVEIIDANDLKWPGAAENFLKIFCGYVGHSINYWERTLNKKAHESCFEEATWDLYQESLRITSGDYLSALENMQLFSRKIAQWYVDGAWDMLLSPTMAIPPLKIGAFEPEPDEPEQWIRNAVSFVAFTRIQNITGQPAVSVPLYRNSAGLPIGVQFAGKSGCEDLLLRLSSQLEEAYPWVNQYPAI